MNYSHTSSLSIPRFTTNLDDAQSIYFARELEHIKSREFNVQYAVPKLFSLVPVDNTSPVGAQAATYRVYDKQHRAKIIAERADDIPKVNVTGKEVSYGFRDIASAYELTFNEIKAAAFTGKSLEPRLLETVKDSILREMDQIGWFGNVTYNIPGWLNNTNINSAPVAGADANARRWFDANRVAVKTPDQILSDLNSAVDYVITNTKGVEEVDTIVLPLGHWRYIQETARSATSDTTILEYFHNANPGVTVTWANELTGTFTGNTNGMIAYKKNPDKIYQEIPEFFEQIAPQVVNLHVDVICVGRYGGVHIPYPSSQVFRYGI